MLQRAGTGNVHQRSVLTLNCWIEEKQIRSHSKESCPANSRAELALKSTAPVVPPDVLATTTGTVDTEDSSCPGLLQPATAACPCDSRAEPY